MEILTVIADQLRELIEKECFSQLSGHLGNNQYVFAKAITIAEARSTSLLIPSISDNPAKLILMVRVKLDPNYVSVSIRVSASTLVTRHNDWYIERLFDCGDPDLFDRIVQYIRNIV